MTASRPLAWDDPAHAPWHRIALDRDVRWSDLSGSLAVDARNSADQTPLMAACRTRNTPLVRDLLQAGADPNATNRTGTTPLMFAKTVALASGDFAVMDLLIAAGADPAARDVHGLRARDYVEARSEAISAYLKAAGG